MEILVRLPPKLVLRSKCVSERWLSPISAPYLRDRNVVLHHDAAANVVTGIFLVPRVREIRDTEFVSFNNGGRRIGRPTPFCPEIHWPCKVITQSCNGLLLMRFLPNRVVYNPTTKDIKELPSYSTPDLEFVHMNLAFDPSRSLSYKVIYLLRSGGDGLDCYYQPIVYSSETRGLRQCKSSFVAPTNMNFSGGTYFSGAIHWTYPSRKLLLCFDVEEECLRNNMPPLPAPHYLLSSTCGYLILFGYDNNTKHLEVFRLDKDYSGWLLIHTVNIVTACRPPTAPPGLLCDVLCLFQDDVHIHRKDNNIKDNISVAFQLADKVIALRLKDNTCYLIRDLGRPGIYPSRVSRVTNAAHAYVESLARV